MIPREPRLARLLLLAVLCVPPAGEVSAGENLEQMQLSTVRIVCKTRTAVSTGSGFVVGTGPITYLATNYHVAVCGQPSEEEGLFVLLTPRDGVALQVVWDDAGQDLAILRAARPLGRPAVQFADTKLVMAGSPVTVVGFPGAADRVVVNADFTVPTVTRGSIGRIVHSGANGVRYFQHSAATNPGDSGGPVYDADGNVVGVNSLKSLTAGVTMSGDEVAPGRMANGEGIALAIDVAELTPHLLAEGIPYAAAGGEGISTSQILLAVTVALLVGAGGILLALPSGRALLFRRDATSISGRRGRMVTGRIRVVDGSLAGFDVPVVTGIVLGRDPAQAQLVFPETDTAVSRRHCDIRFDDAAGLFEVRDLGSRNGTFVVSGAATPRRLPANVVERLLPGEHVLVGSPRNRLVLDVNQRSSRTAI
jgi:S1-C subfamily serine protease